MSTTIYGIKNCNTMKKAMTWLDNKGVTYTFHYYKKQPAPKDLIQSAIQTHGWDTVINRRGTSWRLLDDDIKNTMNEKTALKEALNNPSLIKRPLLVHEDQTYLGFDEDSYQSIFK